MPLSTPITVDFEGKPIMNRPAYPPEPTGVSIKYPGKPSRFYAWAHPSENNCTWGEAVRIIQSIWHGNHEILFHGGKLDQDMAEEYMGVEPLPWERTHETLYQAFLYDPDEDTYKLKELAEKLLSIKPEERDELKQWILQHVPGVTEKGKDLKAPMAWICLAPGGLVGRYACGDTDRTLALHEFLLPKIIEMGMWDAYCRERKVERILRKSERQGLRINVDLLAQDVPTYQQSIQIADDWIRDRLGQPSLNLNAKGALGRALLSSEGALNVTELPKTKMGKPSVSKKNLRHDMYADPALFNVIGYRNRLTTCLGTFMEKWLDGADQHNLIYTNWHQTREFREGERGACTGRPTTSDPPFTNMAKSWGGRNDGYEHPEFLGVPELPLVRQYVEPDLGQWLIHRDWNQQEMRDLAHFENGRLMRAYQERPWRVMNEKGQVKCRLDAHQYVADMVAQLTGLELGRKTGKVLDLGMVYGEGKKKIALQLGIPMDQAKRIFLGHKAALPDLARLQEVIRKLSAAGLPVTTWGGRLYYCQPSRMVKMKTDAGVEYLKRQDFGYKQLNRMIQPSAADQIKEAMIRYDEHPKRQGRFLVAVYDEMNVSAEDWQHEDNVLRECMESIEADVPMLTDGKYGPNWAYLEDINDEEG